MYTLKHATQKDSTAQVQTNNQTSLGAQPKHNRAYKNTQQQIRYNTANNTQRKSNRSIFINNQQKHGYAVSKTIFLILFPIVFILLCALIPFIYMNRTSNTQLDNSYLSLSSAQDLNTNSSLNNTQLYNTYASLGNTQGTNTNQLSSTSSQLMSTQSAEDEENVNYIQISNEEELIAFAERVNGGETTLSASVTADIELTRTWPGIGTSGERYAGTFNGNGHTISGSMATNTSYNGLFGVLTHPARVFNIKVENTITSEALGTGMRAGGLAGAVFGGTIQDCAITLTLSGTFEGTKYIGGLAGQNRSTSSSPLLIQDSIIYLIGAYSIGSSVYIDSISPYGDSCTINNSIAYGPEPVRHNTYSTPYLINSFLLINGDNTDYTSILGEKFVFCPTCNRMELTSFQCVNTPNTSMLAVSLVQNVYTYSGENLELVFAPLEIADGEDVYLEYELSGYTVGPQSAKVTLSGQDKDKYTLDTNTVFFEVAPYELGITIPSQTSVYGEPLKDILYTISPGINGEEIPVSFSLFNESVDLPNAGVYSIIPTIQNPNYTLAKTSSTYTILKREISIQQTSFSKVFDNLPFAFSLTFDNILEKDNLGTMYTLLDTIPTNSGEYTIKIKLADSLTQNYSLSTDTISLLITPRKVSATWNTDTLTFNNSIIYPKASILLDIEYTLPEIQYKGGGVHVGGHAVQAVLQDKNLTLLNDTKTYAIIPYNLELVWENTTHTFDNSPFLPSIKYTLPFEYNIDIELSEPQTNAGKYVATASTKDNNIRLLNPECEYEIFAKNVSVRWEDLEGTYSGKPQSPKYSISLPFEYKISLQGTEYTDAGTYKVTLTTQDKNIVLENGTAEFIIHPYEITLAFENTTQVFSNTPLSPNYTYQLPEGMSKPTITLNSGISAGEHTITATTENPNYKLLNHTTTLTITPYQLTLDWKNTTHTFNNSPFIPSIEYSLPFEYNLNIQVLGAQTYSGEYIAMASTQDKNIEILNPETPFIINPYSLTLVWGNTQHTFDNTPFIPSVEYTIPFNYTITLTLSKPQTQAGTYTATASLTDHNIKITNPSIEYTISPYSLEITWTNTQHTFDNSPFAPTYTYTLPFEYKLNITQTGAEVNAGTYTTHLQSLDNNITLTNNSTEYTISKRTVSLTWQADTYTYTGYIVTPKYDYEDFGYNFEVLTNASTADAGTYTITATCHNPNITLENASHTYTITPRECRIVWTTTQFHYDGTVHVPTFSLEYDDTNLNPNTLPIVQVLGATANLGTHEARAVCNSQNFTLINAITTYTISANEITAETNNGLTLSLSGAIAEMAEVRVENLEETEVDATFLEEYSLIFAINIETNSQTGELNIKMSSLPNLTENFKIFTLDNSLTEPLTEINYTYENGMLTFNTDTLGTFYFVYPAPQTSASSSQNDTLISIKIAIPILLIIIASIIYLIRKPRKKN